MLFAFAACGKKGDEVTVDLTDPAASAIDIDLTKLNSTMVYSQVYNMTNEPDNFMGQTVRMSGNFAIYQNPETGKRYYACLIADAAACCSQGIEFVCDGLSYPNDYPDAGAQITVEGVFDRYEEDGMTYVQLIDAKMAVI